MCPKVHWERYLGEKNSSCLSAPVSLSVSLDFHGKRSLRTAPMPFEAPVTSTVFPANLDVLKTDIFRLKEQCLSKGTRITLGAGACPKRFVIRCAGSDENKR